MTFWFYMKIRKRCFVIKETCLQNIQGKNPDSIETAKVVKKTHY